MAGRISPVNWIKPGKKYEALVRLNAKHLALNNDACEMLGVPQGTKFVDVGVDKDGVIIITHGNAYTISTYPTAHNKLRGRIGGSGLVKQLATGGAEFGVYKMVLDTQFNWWECYFQEKAPGRKKKGTKNFPKKG